MNLNGFDKTFANVKVAGVTLFVNEKEALAARKELDEAIEAFNTLPPIAPGKLVSYESSWREFDKTIFGVVAHPDAYDDNGHSDRVYAYWGKSRAPSFMMRENVREVEAIGRL